MSKSAISPEQWKEVFSAIGQYDWCQGDSPDTCVYLMALNNHRLPEDDERKLTWEHVREIQDAAFAIRRFGGNEPWQRRLEAIANRIAALLPPRDE